MDPDANGAIVVVRDLDIAIRGGAFVGPRADEGRVLAFLEEFAGPSWDESHSRMGRRLELSLPRGPLGVEIGQSFGGKCFVAGKVEGCTSPLEVGDVIESINGIGLADLDGGLRAWGELFRALRDDERSLVVRRRTVSDRRAARAPQVDIRTPNTRVEAFHEEPIEFPACEGTASCAMRTMLEYYCASILRTLEHRKGESGGASPSSNGGGSIADMASVKGSLFGAAVGGVFLGPVGFLAGSYLGGRFGRKHSVAVGATAGACPFGPVGLIAGAAAAAAESGYSGRESSSDADAKGRAASFGAFGASARRVPSMGESGRRVPHRERSVGKSVVDRLSNNKLEYAGTTGVVAGAMAGAFAGPVGMLAGAYAGSVAARSGTNLASEAADETKRHDGRSGYQVGDITRGLVARGKKSRGADRNEKYQFGDFTRGLFAGRS